MNSLGMTALWVLASVRPQDFFYVGAVIITIQCYPVAVLILLNSRNKLRDQFMAIDRSTMLNMSVFHQATHRMDSDPTDMQFHVSSLRL
ncbi:hypothetical protein C8Q74DRAFT_1245314 [Fomes fomentarius]|nr:hypothetical protein C8Q74DRAFT_1245314 [Fomes fomentarius]